MKLIEFCVKYPVTVLVGVLLAILFGVISLFRIPVQMIPTVDRPEITVETEYLGASPVEVEQEVTDRQEEKLNSVENLQEITSTSLEGKSTIVLRFDWGVNKDVARLEVSEKLDLVKDIPEDALEPVIQAVNTDEETPIAWIVIETKRNLNEVWEEVEDVIKPRLERVNGVGAVWRFGGQDREVHALLDHQAMSARGVSIAQVRDAILKENRNIKGGNIDEGKKRYVVRTLGQFTDIRHIEDVIVRRDRGGAVYVKDIAQVRFGHEDRDFAVRVFGKPTIGLGVLRRTGANTLEVMKGIKKEIGSLNAIYQGKDIRLQQAYDETDYVYDAVDLVRGNVYYGALLAVAVLLLFLRSAYSLLIIAFSIPISMVATFAFLDALGRSLNIVTLAGLAFATGMVVDNSIVVLENIFRHLQLGKGRLQAALEGTQEVWGAVLAATLTTLAVFIPVIFVKEEAGQLFRDIAIAISVAVGLSLVISVTMVPMLSARLLTMGNPGLVSKGLSWLSPLDRIGSAFVASLIDLLNWLRQNIRRRVAVVIGITAFSGILSYLLMPPIDYLPQGNQNLIYVVVRTPPGFNIDQKEEIVRELDSRFSAIPEIERTFAVIRLDNPIMGAIVRREHADLPGMRRVVEGMRQRANGIPGAEKVLITQAPLFRRRGLFIGGTNIELDVKGDDLETIRGLSGELEAGLKTLPEVNFVNSSFEWGNPELQVRVDREKAADLGLSVAEVGYVVETLVEGTEAGVFREGGKEIDIKLKGPTEGVNRTQDLDAILLFTPAGRLMRLSDVASVKEEAGPTKVEHIDLDRAIRLTTNIRGDVPLEQAIREVNRKVVDGVRRALPLGYTINVSGQAKDLTVAWGAFKGTFLLAIIIGYLLMCSLFESWVNPLIILFSVPLAVTGGILAVRLAHTFEPAIKMDVITMLGFVILAGIVVNNAILIVHQALNYRREGYPPQEALLESVRTRIRPIFMTATTTVFGMLPLVLSRGAGSELYRGLGSVVLGGLTLSTLFTLILVPTLYSLWLDVERRLVGFFSGRKVDGKERSIFH